MRADKSLAVNAAAALLKAEHRLPPDGTPLVAIHVPLDPKSWAILSRTVQEAGGRWSTPKQAFTFPPGTNTQEEMELRAALLLSGETNPHDFFATPDNLADTVVRCAMSDDDIAYYQDPTLPKLKVLEPSIGTGALIKALLRRIDRSRLDVIAFEIDPGRRATVQREVEIDIRPVDFLTAQPDSPVDLVLMNPPFSGPKGPDTWAHHVQHALTWLKPDGHLGAIVSPRLDRVEQRNANKPTDAIVLDLLAMANAMGGIEHIEADAFAHKEARGPKTGIETRLLHLITPAATDWQEKPREGYSNWYTWATTQIILNNDYRLLESTIDNGSCLKNPREIEAQLLRHRHAWIRNHAPWLSTRVDVKELATKLHRYFADNGSYDDQAVQQHQLVPSTPYPAEPAPAAPTSRPSASLAKNLQIDLFSQAA